MFHQANHCADVQTTIHRLDEPGAQNRGIRLINKAAKAAGGCLLTGWVLIRQNMIRRCAIIVSACIGNFYKEVLCKNTVSMKILLCLCAASASHFRPSGQAAASASLRVEVDVEDQPQRIEIQVLGLNPSHAQQTRDEVWPDMIRYDQIWPDMTRYDQIWPVWAVTSTCKAVAAVAACPTNCLKKRTEHANALQYCSHM